MKTILKIIAITGILVAAFLACNNTMSKGGVGRGNDFVHAYHPDKEFNDYWYGDKAALSHYKLKQARYGEIHDGDAVLVFVAEDESPDTHVKAADKSDNNIPILKNNFYRSFITGIYPYSLLTTIETPVNVAQNAHSMRESFSGQEWCGMVFNILDYHKGNWDYTQHSYFPDEGDKTSTLRGAFLEDEIWNRIRIDYKSLPVGDIEIVPSLMHLRLQHKEMKVYRATAALSTTDYDMEYAINYTDLDRKLLINFSSKFPHRILSWSETYKDGFGPDAKQLTTEAQLDTTIMLDYWSHHTIADSVWRKTLMGNTQ